MSQFGWWHLPRDFREGEPPTPLGTRRKGPRGHLVHSSSQAPFSRPTGKADYLKLWLATILKKLKKGGKVLIYQLLPFPHYHLWKQNL